MGVFYFYAGIIGFAMGIAARSLMQFSNIEVIWVLLLAFGVGVVGRPRRRATPAPHPLGVDPGGFFFFFFVFKSYL
ncbi:MAG: hypothetical protein AAGA35_03950 [Patescibacteria group bacterium]